MGYEYKVNIANQRNFGGLRDEGNIRYIVIHYTGNDGDHDESNARYFKNNIVKASAHLFVDDDSITQSVPFNRVAWSVGGNKYSSCSKTGGGQMYGKCTNANSINIELCDTVKNGTVYPSQATIDNALSITMELMERFHIPAANVIRHFDVTGKLCPAYWVDNTKWINEFAGRLIQSIPQPSIPTPQAPDEADNTAPSDYSKSDFIKEIQQALGAKVDGVAGPETLSKTVTISARTNRKHPAVKVLQKRLNSIGFDCGVIDGIAGSKFTNAVKAYQGANGCISDGSITAKNRTWKKLLGLN